MTFRLLRYITLLAFVTAALSSCSLLRESSKYSFNDGLYQTKRFSHHRVYVLKIDDDTISVFPVLEFKDSTAILTKQRVNYTPMQRKFKDNKISHTFYKPSFDLDIITIPAKFRPATYILPNQFTTNFNGAVFGGYRIDAYKVNYSRTPLNVYKQKVKHSGYSAGLFAGIGNTLLDDNTLRIPNTDLLYEGMILITGVAANVAVENITFGISVGTDYLLDKNSSKWIYQGMPCVGFTVGLDLN